MKTINEIDTKTEDGKMLLAAIVKITTESQTYSTPDEVMEQVDALKNEMYPE